MHCGRGLRLGCSLAIVFCFMLHGLMAGSTGCCRVLLQHLVAGRPGHATPLLPSLCLIGHVCVAKTSAWVCPVLSCFFFLFYFTLIFVFFFYLAFFNLIFFVLYAWIKFSKSKRAFDQCANWTRCCCCGFFFLVLAYLLTRWRPIRRRAASLLPGHNLY